MKHNTMKRALALTLSVLTVAAPMSANVGGVLQEAAIVASAFSEADLPEAQSGGYLTVAENMEAYIEGLYVITVDAGKAVYTKVSGTKVFTLDKDKSYVLRTKAYVKDLDAEEEDLNDEDLADGIYEYVLDNVGEGDFLKIEADMDVIQKPGDIAAFPENPTIKQNGVTIVYDADKQGYEVAKGFPVEITATPGETHTNMMMTVSNGTVKSQTKSGKAITLTFVPEKDEVATEINWDEYKPTLELTYADGNITATDIGFNALVSNKVVGTYELKYGKEGNNGSFKSADVNSKGEYIADGTCKATPEYTNKNVTINNTTYTFLADDAITEYQKKKADGSWDDATLNADITQEEGTYRVTTYVEANGNGQAVLNVERFKIVTEIKVAKQSVTSEQNLTFKVTNKDGVEAVIDPENGVYNVPWQNGDEITPELTLVDANDVEYKQQGDQPADDDQYYVTGTTTASEAGTYTMTIVPINKAFNNGAEIVITWKIVNTNNYVKFKKGVDENCAFKIAYRQATLKALKEQINKKLDFVGSTDLYIVEYRDADNNVVSDPSEKAGDYVAYVANALKNDGKTSAMVMDGEAVDDLFAVPFTIDKTLILIQPNITEITYGDDVKLNELYKVIDSVTKEEILVPWDEEPTITLTNKNVGGNDYAGEESTKELPAGEYTYTVDAVVLDDTNYDVRQIVAEDDVEFTVKQRNLSDIDFGIVNVPIVGSKTNVKIDAVALSEAANNIEANPVLLDEEGADILITGGTTSAKVTDLGKSFTVTIKGVENFTGTKTVTWVVGNYALNDKVMSYEAEFDASKPRVMAKLDLNEVDGEVDECGFYYCNNGKMNDLPLDGKVDKTGKEDTTDSQVDNENVFYAQDYLTNLFKEVDKTGANMNQKGARKVSFSDKAVATALSGKGLLTAEIANSSVLKQVYIMPYVKYKNGNVAYGKVESFNYYDMVLAAEGALKMTKTDFIGDGKTGTAGQTYVKVDVTRVDKKGYEVERYGIVYNNSDTWNENPVQAANVGDGQKDTVSTEAEMRLAYRWLDIAFESEKTVKVAEVPSEDLAKKIGTNTYIANTTAKLTDDKGKVKKDYGYGAKTVYAKAFIKIKDASGNEKVYYSHLADVTYGGFTVDAEDGSVNGTESGKYITDSKNKDQILFYAPTNANCPLETADADDCEKDKDGVKILKVNDPAAEMTRMAASTGNKTFAVDWTDSKKS